MARVRFFPPDDVTHGEWRYLRSRYSEADAADRREQVGAAIRRVVRKGIPPRLIREALMRGVRLYEHTVENRRNAAALRRYRSAVIRARRDVARALASLRRLIPPEAHRWISDDDLFADRELLLAERSLHVASGPRGRPVAHWRRTADAALRDARVSFSDRRAGAIVRAETHIDGFDRVVQVALCTMTTIAAIGIAITGVERRASAPGNATDK